MAWVDEAWVEEPGRLGHRRFEAPTLGLATLIYGGWLLLTFWWRSLPIWVAAPLGAWLCAWQMSLQHEVIHGHPTPYRRLNDLIGAPPLNLWLPYAIYKDSHMRHHRDADLTDPLEDPESTYMTAHAWARAGRLRRGLHLACNTLLGRLLLGPARAAAHLWLRQARGVWPNGAAWSVWLGHGLGVALVLAWVCGVCHISLFTYAAWVVYPAAALSMIRSLAEHQAAPAHHDRTAVVENAGLLGVLFLNNNLHVLHHERPSLPWYALPAAWRETRGNLLTARRGPVYRGYIQVATLYALRPHHPGPHPVFSPMTTTVEGWGASTSRTPSLASIRSASPDSKVVMAADAVTAIRPV
jgi:fatty acid desaturase